MITRQPLGAEEGRVYLKANTLILIAPNWIGSILDSEGESFSVVNGGAAQAEVFSDFIGTSMCHGVNARDRR